MTESGNSREDRLQRFVDWVGEHLTGDEKGEAQLFLDRLMQAFAQKGLKECGATAEFRIKKSAEDGGGTAFADFVWKPLVLIEMKRRGADLAKHYDQAFRYWERLVPDRPRYVILCNFDEFWVYDFDTQLDEPLDRLGIEELPERWGPLAFLFPTAEPPVFRNNQEEVTRDAADRLALLFSKLVTRGVEREQAQRFVLQCLVALFAEDIDLLPKYFFARLLDECDSPSKAYDLIGGLFRAMNTEGGEAGGRYKGVDYFNGGLFAEPVSIELHEDELNQLKQAAAQDWSKVRPEIFGTIFEHSLDGDERHAYGAHFTSGVDIMKIVRPTIVDPWEQLIDRAASRKNATTRRKELRRLQEHLSELRVLDPACGSGNFLYLAYRWMKRIERRLLDVLKEGSTEQESRFGLVTASQFYGMDINPFAVELAKVTMMIARKLAIDELHIQEQALPLDNLDGNFVTGDALITFPDEGDPVATPWPAADVIIGNPPFLGAKRLKPERGVDYVNAVRKLYPDVPGMADYCVYWFRRAHDHLPDCTPEAPWAGRAGLVGTQNIRNNKSRVGGMDHIVASGTVVEAVDNQPWSGEANVHVSIANWVKHADGVDEAKVLIPRERRLWFVASTNGSKKRRHVAEGPSIKDYELDVRNANQISASISDLTDVSGAREIKCNTNPQVVFQGVTPGHDGFVLSISEAKALIAADRASEGVVFPYLVGKGLLTGDSTPTRMVIDFQQRNLFDVQKFPGAYKHVSETVLKTREEKAEEDMRTLGYVRPHHQNFLQRWWKLAWDRADLTAATEKLDTRFLVCSRVTKRPVFAFISVDVRPGDALQCFVFDDDYSFGVLQSDAHWQWFVAKCSKLKSDYRYTPESVFDTFPWPQSPSAAEIDAVAEAGREVRRVRDDALAKIKGGLRKVYATLEQPGKNPLRDAHATLDASVLKAYGFSAKKDLLKQILDLNLDVAARIDRGDPVTAPGVPPDYPDPAILVTDDCIRPK